MDKEITIEVDEEDFKPIEYDFRAVALKTMKFILKELKEEKIEDTIIKELFNKKK